MAEQKFRPVEFDVFPPIQEAKQMEVDGVIAFAFHNTGEVDVKLNDFFTVKANGGTFSMGIQMAEAALITRLKIQFVAGAGTRNLEVATLRFTGPEYSNL